MIGRAVFYAEPLDGKLIFATFSGMIMLTINLLVFHLIITKVGMIYVEAEILRTGNEELLNNLEEGVVILDNENEEILFVNSAAKQFKFGSSVPLDN